MLPGRQYTPLVLAAIAWRYRWVIVVPTILGAYAALIVSSRLPNVYQSEMLIQVVPQRVPDAYVRSTVTLRTEDRLSALSEQIMSRTELERLIKEMNLYPEERAAMPMQDVVEKMRRAITIEPIRTTRGSNDPDSFHVRFSYDSADQAAKVTERLGALLIDVNARDRGDLAAATNNFLQTQLLEARQRLEQQEARLKQFRERNAGRLPTQLAFNMQVIQNTQLAVQALVESLARDRDRKLMLERLEADAQQELVTAPPMPQPQQAPVAAPSTPEPSVPTTGSTAQQLAVAKDLLAKLELRLTPEHPDVVRTRRIITGLEKRLHDEATAAAEAAAAAAADASNGTPATPTPIVVDQAQAARRERIAQMRAEIESLARQIQFKEDKEQQLRGSLVDYQQRIEQVPGVESEWVALTRDYDTQQAAYRDLLGKSEQAKVATELEKRQIGEQFRILDPAGTPVRPTGVNRLEINVMGAAIGLGLGLLIVAVLELRDRTFRTATDVLEACKLPVLALLPRLVTEAERRRARSRRLLLSGFAAVLVFAGTYVFWMLRLWNYVV